MGFLALLIALALTYPVLWWMDKKQFKERIKRFNKRNTDIQLDEKTKLSVFNKRYNDWYLTTFCDKKLEKEEEKKEEFNKDERNNIK